MIRHPLCLPAIVDAGLTSRSGISAFRSRGRPSESWHTRSIPILDRLSLPVSTCCSNSKGCSVSVYLAAETHSRLHRTSFLSFFFFIHAVHLFDRWNALQLLIDWWTKAVTFFLSPLFFLSRLCHVTSANKDSNIHPSPAVSDLSTFIIPIDSGSNSLRYISILPLIRLLDIICYCWIYLCYKSDRNRFNAPCFTKCDIGVTHNVTWTWRYNRYGETDFLEERSLCVFRFRRVARQLTEVHANGTIDDRFERFVTSDWHRNDRIETKRCVTYRVVER